jgi:hypothetical protein
MSSRIFVAIPSYRDRELPATLLDLVAKAKWPGNLRIVVAWQFGRGETLPRSVRTLKNVEIIPVPADQSLGPNWARRMLQDRYDGEEFTLLLDSHHRFVPGWDQAAREMFDGLRKICAKPILTAYLPPYDPARDPRGRKREVLKIYPLHRTSGLLTHLTGRRLALWRTLRAPVPAAYASLHFLFAEGSLHREILFDPEIYFFGDEVFTGLRAFTHGYDLYHPHRILGWHLYDRATRTPHWDDHAEWRLAESLSFEKMRAILSGKVHSHGLFASVRSVRAYEKHIGTSLIERDGTG